MLKAVVDTNVLVSGTILSRGNPFEILEAWRRGELILVISREIMAEAATVLRRPKIFRRYRLTENQLTSLLMTLEQEAVIVTPDPVDPLPGLKPPDLKVLACAREGHADYIVSGDDDLLNLKGYEGIPIVTPGAFLTLLKATA